MRLEHMSDLPVDLKDQMQELSRLTTNMLIADLASTNDGGELYPDIMHTYGMPESNEMLFLRFGTDHLMELVKDAQPSD